jgi:hypothetical protein
VDFDDADIDINDEEYGEITNRPEEADNSPITEFNLRNDNDYGYRWSFERQFIEPRIVRFSMPHLLPRPCGRLLIHTISHLAFTDRRT